MRAVAMYVLVWDGGKGSENGVFSMPRYRGVRHLTRTCVFSLSLALPLSLAFSFRRVRMLSLQATKNTITLKGSTEIVTEFFGYSINSILYQVRSLSMYISFTSSVSICIYQSTGVSFSRPILLSIRPSFPSIIKLPL